MVVTVKGTKMGSTEASMGMRPLRSVTTGIQEPETGMISQVIVVPPDT